MCDHKTEVYSRVVDTTARAAVEQANSRIPARVPFQETGKAFANVAAAGKEQESGVSVKSA
jgi:hypothetical protein